MKFAVSIHGHQTMSAPLTVPLLAATIRQVNITRNFIILSEDKSCSKVNISVVIWQQNEEVVSCLYVYHL